MNRIKPARIVLFVCVLAVIAIFIHSIQSRREKQAADAAEEVRQNAEREAAATKAIKDTTEATEQAAKTAATEHKNFLEKYVDTGITKKAASHMVAVAVTSETRAMNHAVAVALISHFKADHVQLTDSFFKPELVTDALFSSAFNGSSDLFKKLELAKSLDALLLARQTVNYQTNADLNGLITAYMTLEITALPVAGQIQSQSWTLSAKGAGFQNSEARMQAEERIIKQIETDAKMSLGF